MTGFRPAADSFRRIVANVVNTFTTRPVDYWTTFLAGSAGVDVWVAGPESFVLQLTEFVGDDFDTRVLATVAIVPNTDIYEPEQWDVIGDQIVEGQCVVLASFKGLDAAVGFALDRVCARSWFAGAQNTPDAVSV